MLLRVLVFNPHNANICNTRALHDICSQEQSNASTCSMQRPNSRVVPKQCFQCLQLVQCCYNCTMFTARTMPRNVCNVYNSYPQFVSLSGLHSHVEHLCLLALLQCCKCCKCCKCCIPTHNTMDAPTVTNPLVTPFWGLSLVQVINTDLNSTSLFFSSFFSSWKTGFNF